MIEIMHYETSRGNLIPLYLITDPETKQLTTAIDPVNVEITEHREAWDSEDNQPFDIETTYEPDDTPK